MKVETERNVPFNPFTLKITIETEDEGWLLWHLMNRSEDLFMAEAAVAAKRHRIPSPKGSVFRTKLGCLFDPIDAVMAPKR